MKQLENVYLLPNRDEGAHYSYEVHLRNNLWDWTRDLNATEMGKGSGKGGCEEDGKYGRGDGSAEGCGRGFGYGWGYGKNNSTGNGFGNGNGNGFGSACGAGSFIVPGAGPSTNGSNTQDGVYYGKYLGEWIEIAGLLQNSFLRNLPEKFYDIIDKEFIQGIKNLEILRLWRDKIGLKKYLEFFDAKVIDKQVDNQGNQMKLYEYDERGGTVILLEVICPSTGRMYHIHPPNQRAKSCKQAKASTFGNVPIHYRHGDVGLFKVDGKAVRIPFSET